MSGVDSGLLISVHSDAKWDGCDFALHVLLQYDTRLQRSQSSPRIAMSAMRLSGLRAPHDAQTVCCVALNKAKSTTRNDDGLCAVEMSAVCTLFDIALLSAAHSMRMD